MPSSAPPPLALNFHSTVSAPVPGTETVVPPLSSVSPGDSPGAGLRPGIGYLRVGGQTRNLPEACTVLLEPLELEQVY